MPELLTHRAAITLVNVSMLLLQQVYEILHSYCLRPFKYWLARSGIFILGIDLVYCSDAYMLYTLINGTGKK